MLEGLEGLDGCFGSFRPLWCEDLHFPFPLPSCGIPMPATILMHQQPHGKCRVHCSPHAGSTLPGSLWLLHISSARVMGSIIFVEEQKPQSPVEALVQLLY